ncbi:hypothetical protein PFISCL1PPCAC_22521, partial [Pristionchus fissidentatus]
ALVLAGLLTLAQGRVTFTTSEVLDTVDLKNTRTAAFRCFAGCRVYSPTNNAHIVIVDSNGVEGKSLIELSANNPLELPPGNSYSLKNKGNANPKFIFYAVEKGAMNYNSDVIYIDDGSIFKIGGDSIYKIKSPIVTILSTSGTVNAYNFVGDYSNSLPTIHATGFDAIYDKSCRPVYTASSPTTVLNSVVPVYGPIATINFKTVDAAKSFFVSGDPYMVQTITKDSSGVVVSPGYVGCSSTGDSLYTQTPLTTIDKIFTRSDSSGLSVVVDGDYVIAKEADALQLTVNNDAMKLWGNNTISKIYDATSFVISVKWTQKEGNKDRFALQMDMYPSGNSEVQSTTNGEST